MKQLGRFLRLERARKDSERELPLPPRRFATLEEAPVSDPTAPHPAAGLERFVPEPASELELERPDGDEPFVRCLRCGADSVRHASVCRQCEARLDTVEVRAFNIRIWADMTAARERETHELRQRELLRSDSAASSVPRAAEFAARAQARHALETPSRWASSARWGQLSFGGLRVPRLLLGLAVGIPLLMAFSRRGTLGVGASLLAGLLVLLLLVLRRPQ